MAHQEKPAAPESDQPSHVIVKGAVVYLPHAPDVGLTVREAVYARQAGPGNKKGWHWYRVTGDTTLWRDGIQPLSKGSSILVGPKGAVKT